MEKKLENFQLSLEIDYIFPRRVFSSKKSARAKTLTEWEIALTHKK